MSRPIWTGMLSFGLLNVPIRLMPAERKNELRFHLIDRRDQAPVQYRRVNSETGAEVPWQDVVKAYEYRKGRFVTIDEEDLRGAASERRELVEIDRFVPVDAVPLAYFEKPYVLVPDRKAEKGYVLLRETLRQTKQLGLGRVVIRTREYLAAVLPQGEALLLILLRYPEELVDWQEYALPDRPLDDYRVTPRELEMARELVEAMEGDWRPEEYRNEFRERLSAAIEQRLQQQGKVAQLEQEGPPPEAATNVVDFMALLRQSLEKQRSTPASGLPAERRPPRRKAHRSSSATRKAEAGSRPAEPKSAKKDRAS